LLTSHGCETLALVELTVIYPVLVILLLPAELLTFSETVKVPF